MTASGAVPSDDLREAAGRQAFRLPGLGADTRALVTGGTGAIGLRTAECLLALGARVVLMSRSDGAVKEACAGLDAGDRVLGVAGDVSAEPDAARAVAAAAGEWGGLDVLVHCAAVSDDSPLEHLDSERISRLLSINVVGTMLMARAAAPAMGTGASIVNVSSVMAHRVWPERSLYATSKAAVVHASRALAAELGPRGIRVNSVSPGNTPTVLRTVDEAPGARPVSSPGGSAGRIPLRRRGSLDDYVGPILFLASSLAAYTTAVDIVVDGGLTVLRP